MDTHCALCLPGAMILPVAFFPGGADRLLFLQYVTIAASISRSLRSHSVWINIINMRILYNPWSQAEYTGGYTSLVPRRVRDDPRKIAHKLCTTPGGWAFVIFVFIYLALIRYCSHAYYRDPTSAFFNPRRGYERLYSLERQKQTDAFIRSTSNNSLPVFESAVNPPTATTSKEPTLCIGIATVKRPGEQYIQSTVGSLLEGLTEQQRREIYLIVLIAHTDPQTHPIRGEKWLETLCNRVLLYDLSAEEFEHLRRLEEEKDYRRKAIFDYTYLLEHCAGSRASWIAMIEDDTLAVDGWYSRAITAIDEADARKPDWLYLRLFFTEEFFGWNSEQWPQYLASSVLVVIIVASILSAVRFLIPPARLSSFATAVICLLCTPACILLYFMAGKLSMHPLSAGIHEMPNYGCCAQGLVFSQEMAPRVIDRLQRKELGFVDMLIEEWANEEGLTRWAIIPSLLQHIGMHSSKGDDFAFGDQQAQKLSVAERIWNFGFELYKPERR